MAADTFVGPKIEFEPGGDTVNVKSGGVIAIASGGSVTGTRAATKSTHSVSAETNTSAGAPAPICFARREDAPNAKVTPWPVRAVHAAPTLGRDSARLAAA